VSDINKERKNAVREAWKNERAHVRGGNGTRDWSQTEQKEIVAKGRANGYEVHHMKSVKDYPQHAGDPKNIQFLNRSEHVDGAHKGNTQNSTNGYYNPSTKTMPSSNNGIESVRNQSTRIKSANTQSNQNKGIEAARQKSTGNTSGANTTQSSNQGIKNYQNKASGQLSGSTSKRSGSGSSQSKGNDQGK